MQSEKAMDIGDMDVYDTTIIGAGPAGLFGAFYAGLRNMRTKIIEALPHVGGQLTVLYPDKFIYDVAGYPKILSKDLVKCLAEQAFQFNPTVCLGERVGSLEYVNGDIIRLSTNVGSHHSKTVIICAGVGAFAPNKLNRPGVEKFENRGVFYFVKDKAYFRGKRVLIIGGGDSAVDWALTLNHWAQEVKLIHRRDVFRAHESSVTDLFNSGVEVRLFWELKEIHGDDKVEAATVFANQTGEEETLPVDAVLINIGFKADIGPIADWGLELNKRAIKVNGMMETNLPGVYAAGDIADPVGSVHLKLIATGFAQATIAVNCAKHYIDPQSRVFPGHSSQLRL